MVAIEHSENGLNHRIVVRPNQSLSWRATACVYVSLLLVSGSIAGGMALLGYWPVLPFAGLEMLFLGIVLYVVARQGQQREVISVTPDNILVEKGRFYPEQQWKFLRVWSTVILERCPKRWYPSRLLIRSHGRGVVIGEFLNEEERQRLATELSRCLVYAPRGSL